MKTLTDYVQENQTKAFEYNGAFFAFSNEQLDEKKQDGVKYVSLGAGLVCPVNNAKRLVGQLKLITKQGIQQDVKENGIDAIIKREMYNYEAFYTGDFYDVQLALEEYPITKEDIERVCKQEVVSFYEKEAASVI